MVNPFHNSDTNILKEAFPLLEVSVIEDILYAAKGDVNEAFEMLLSMSNETKLPPQLPSRRISANPNPSLNPFLNNNEVAKSLTVREELAQWRQDLRNESRRKQTLHNNSSSRTSTSTSSPSCQHNISSHRSFQRTSNTLRSSLSSPNVNIQFHNRNHSIPNDNYSSLSLNSLPPELPRRRLRNSATSDTIPFINTTSPSHVTHQTATSTVSLDADAPTLNPFEVPEFPPPAYSEISADTIIYPH